MANQEDSSGANEGTPALEIPNLKQKEKEKERKKGAVAWTSAKPGSGFTGATGGNGAAAAAAGGGARSAASSAASRLAALAGGGQGQAGAGILQYLSGMSSTLGGKIALAGSAVLAAGLGMYALSVLLGGSDSAGGRPNLGALASTIKVRPAGMANPNVGRGEIKFNEQQAGPTSAAEKTEAQPETADAQPAEAADKTLRAGPWGLAGRDTFAHNLSGAKLTTDLGGSARGGATASAAGASQAAAAQRVSTAKTPAQQGKLSAMRSAARAGRATPMNLNRARSSRAIGQLKMARGMSVMAAGTTAADPARTAAADAFDQGATAGGQMSDPGAAGTPIGGPTGTTGSVNPVGGVSGGAPDVTMPGAQPTMPGYNVTPYQNALDSALSLAAQAAALKKKSMNLILIGGIMIATGLALMSNPLTAVAGAFIAAAGTVLVGMGIMMFMQAQAMAKQARQHAEQIKAQYGQQYQKQIIDECMDQALANGTSPKDCNPATRPNPTSTVQDDVRNERESPVTFEGPRVVH